MVQIRLIPQKAAFNVKNNANPTHLVSRESNKLMNATHFYLESPGASLSDMVSSSKKDYVHHNYSTVPSRYASKPTAKTTHSLIECEEMIPPIQKIKKEIYRVDPRVNHRKDWNDKSISHVSFGDSSVNDWTTVSQKTLVDHPTQGKRVQSLYETLEKTKSTVLDNPDLVLGPLQTVHQAGKLYD